MNHRCPKCNSEDVKIVDYMDIKCVVCNKCGFDETKQYEQYPSEKSNQSMVLSSKLKLIVSYLRLVKRLILDF